jgi:hypothetical protein
MTDYKWDDPYMDGTEGAHPAWWRGNEAGVLAVIKIINKALTLHPRTGYGLPALNTLYDRVLELAQFQAAHSPKENK